MGQLSANEDDGQFDTLFDSMRLSDFRNFIISLFGIVRVR
jgi:hypothetical protein